MKPVVKRFNEDDEFFIEEGCYIVEVSNSEDDPYLSIARVRVEVGVSTHLHSLKNIIERYVIIAGQASVSIGGLNSTNIYAGDIVVIPPSSPQKIKNIGNEDLLFIAICTPRFNKRQYQSL